MKLRIAAIGLAVAGLLVVTAVAALGGGADGEPADLQETAGPDEQAFIGLSLAEAVALAEQEARPWRIARQDGEHFALTADLQPGRVTFELDGGLVATASIERPHTDPPEGTPPTEDPARAQLIADAFFRLATADSSVSAGSFGDLRVSTRIGTTGATLTPLDRELTADLLSELGDVSFVEDPNALTGELFDEPFAGIAVFSIERIELLDDRAEIELSVWCGPLCGVFLTYEADLTAEGGWEILGTVGPIAMS